MSFTDGISLFSGMFTNMVPFGLDWLLGIILVLLTAFILTREIQRWGQLLLPITVMWNILGINMVLTWYIIVTIMFAISIMSSDMITTAISTIAKNTYKMSKFGLKREEEKIANELRIQANRSAMVDEMKKAASLGSTMSNVQMKGYAMEAANLAKGKKKWIKAKSDLLPFKEEIAKLQNEIDKGN